LYNTNNAKALHHLGSPNNNVRALHVIEPILWGHSGPLSRVVVVVDIDAQVACDSSDTWWMAM